MGPAPEDRGVARGGLMGDGRGLWAGLCSKLELGALGRLRRKVR